jgi:hypothetical protein
VSPQETELVVNSWKIYKFTKVLQSPVDRKEYTYAVYHLMMNHENLLNDIPHITARRIPMKLQATKVFSLRTHTSRSSLDHVLFLACENNY